MDMDNRDIDFATMCDSWVGAVEGAYRFRYTLRRACVVTRTHRTFADTAFAAAGPGQFTFTSQRCGLVVKWVPAVTKDILFR